FVIAAGYDSMPAVLGYSTDGTFDADNISPEMKALLDSYTMVADGKVILDLPNREGRAPVAPMVKARWDQGAPWNNACPIVPGEGVHAPTGCGATAMAQVMSYHRWPEKLTKNLPAYTTGALKLNMPELPASGYPGWANIKDYYPYDETSGPAVDDVAQFMLYVAYSINTNFSLSSGSVPGNISKALVNYFGYQKTAHYATRANFVSSEWHSMLYNELVAGRPVVYFGFTPAGGGHGFVCDGYDGNDMYHINWGWSGRGNGFFTLTTLNPAQEGFGAAEGDEGYTTNTGMVMGIQPDRGESEPADTRLTISNMSVSPQTYTRSNSSNAFTNIGVSFQMTNLTNVQQDFYVAVALLNAEGGANAIEYQHIGNIAANGAVGRTFSCNALAGVTSGTYKLAILNKTATSNWTHCLGNEASCVEFIVNGNTLTLKPTGNIGSAGYTVNSVAFNGAKQATRPIEVVANLTNTGNTAMANIYTLVNGKSLTSTTAQMMPGETGDVITHFVPQTAGTYQIVLATDEAGNRQIYSGSLTITDPVAASLSFSPVKVLNANETAKVVGGGEFKGTATVTNNGTEPYNDIVITKIYRYIGTDEPQEHASRETLVSLLPGQSQDVDFTYVDFQLDQQYMVTYNYYDAAQLVRGTESDFYTVQMEMPPMAKPGDINGDDAVDVLDLNILINVLLGSDKKDYGTATDITGDGIVDIADINALINLILAA
ncbi:MAG: C10 family peptidase, partial [Bacteroidales bacterium]|nr:C10 family peptidase [Candidatus Sodaliphilus aphodohippi]